MWTLILSLLAASGVAQSPRQAATRALDYLAREVPLWKQENGCYSCHNNGDAARALIVGRRTDPVKDTLRWLASPTQWDAQQTTTAFRDKNLARIQFAYALAQAVEAKLITDPQAVTAAAKLLKEIQSPDGSWRLAQEANIGSPATYGTALATYAAIRVLTLAGGYDPEVSKAKQWLREQKPVATPDLAAAILTFRTEAARDTLLKMQTSDGGWGPYRSTPAEPFDTALAILSLGSFPEARAAVDKGTQWLVTNQLENGGWAATTRPSGNVSYAQHVSTTGWATLALLSQLPR